MKKMEVTMIRLSEVGGHEIYGDYAFFHIGENKPWESTLELWSNHLPHQRFFNSVLRLDVAKQLRQIAEELEKVHNLGRMK